MGWFIDGSNLGGATGGRSGARDAAAVVRRLLPWARGRRERMVVVFDGEPDPRVAARYDALEVVWSGAGRSADDRIAAAVAAAISGGRESATVVTNDVELQRRCRELGARIERATALLERVAAPKSHPAKKGDRLPKEKPEPTRAEAEKWLGLFGGRDGERSPGSAEPERALPKRRRAVRGALRLIAALGVLGATSACDSHTAYLPITGNVTAAEMAKRPLVDACLLLLRSDVDPGGELGLTKGSSLIDEHEGPFFAKCAYGRRGPWRYVGIEVRRSLSVESARRVQAASRPFLRRLAREPLVDVPGVGEAAVWAGGPLGQLHVQEGDLRFIFTVEEVGADADRMALATRLAELALDRIHALGWDHLKSAGTPAAAAPS